MCFGCLLVVYIMRDFCLQCFSAPVLWFVNALHFANSIINKFVYTFRMPIFKDALKKFWCKPQQNLEVQPGHAHGLGLISGGTFTLQMERTNCTKTTTEGSKILTLMLKFKQLLTAAFSRSFSRNIKERMATQLQAACTMKHN